MKILAFAVTIISVAGSINTASAVDGTINFTGTITSTGCSVNSVAGIGSTTGSVDFGQVNSTTLANPGDSSVGSPFSIELTDCATSVVPEITFSGTQVDTNSYTNTFESGTAGVGIKITDAASSSTVYAPGSAATNSGLSDLSTGSATGNFNAYLVAYDGSDKSGEVDASVTFTIDYSGS